ALGYVEVDGAWRSNVFHLPVRGSGDGGIYSTAADMSSFWLAFFAGRIVSADWVGDGSAAQRRAETLEALRAGLLAPRVERRRPPGGVRRGCLVPVRARSARTRDAHGDLEHKRWRVADRSVSRECGFELSDFPRKSAYADTG